MKRVPRLLFDRIGAPSVKKRWIPPLVPVTEPDALIQIPALPLPHGASEAAKRWVDEGRITIFGQDIDTGWPVDWGGDPFNTFPRRFGQDINYYGKGIDVDIKIPWEIHRLSLLPALAEVLPASEWAEFVLEWAAKHPVHSTIAWMEGIEQALRAMAIAQGMARIDASGISEELQGRLRGLLAVHGHWCAKHRSTKWRQNTNHLLLEEMGALVVGAALSDVPRYQAMGRRAAVRLAKELDRQTCDGRNWEPTTAYHRFVTEALLVTLSSVRILKNCSASNSLEALAEKHVETLQWLCTTGGMMPLVGDDDAGVVLPRSNDWDARQCSEVLKLAHELGFNTNVKDGVRIWSDVGMGVIRSEPWHAHLVAGAPKGKRRQASHRHLDMLSLTVHHHDEPIILDGGTRTYFGSAAYRDDDRQPTRHSGLVPSSIKMGVMTDRFEIKRPCSGIISVRDNRLSAAIETPKGQITREVEIQADCINVFDNVTTPSTATLILPATDSNPIRITLNNHEIHPSSEVDNQDIKLNAIEIGQGYGRSVTVSSLIIEQEKDESVIRIMEM